MRGRSLGIELHGRRRGVAVRMVHVVIAETGRDGHGDGRARRSGVDRGMVRAHRRGMALLV